MQGSAFVREGFIERDLISSSCFRLHNRVSQQLILQERAACTSPADNASLAAGGDSDGEPLEHQRQALSVPHLDVAELDLDRSSTVVRVTNMGVMCGHLLQELS